jgi:hypothetical protein
MKRAYDYFDKTKELPLVMVNKRGAYVVEANIPEPAKVEKVVKKRDPRPARVFSDDELAKVVDKLPEFPGGNQKFQVFIDELSKEMAGYLGEEQPKTFVMMEFIIDKEGKPTNAKVLKGGNEELNAILEERFDKMPVWTPAIRTEKNVAVRLKQTIFIEKAKP